MPWTEFIPVPGSSYEELVGAMGREGIQQITSWWLSLSMVPNVNTTRELQKSGWERQLTRRASASQKLHTFKIRFQCQLKQNQFSISCCNFPFIGRLYTSNSTLPSTSANSWYLCSIHCSPLPLATNINHFMMPFILPSGTQAFFHQQNPSCNCSRVTPSFIFSVSWIPEFYWKYS